MKEPNIILYKKQAKHDWTRSNFFLEDSNHNFIPLPQIFMEVLLKRKKNWHAS